MWTVDCWLSFNYCVVRTICLLVCAWLFSFLYCCHLTNKVAYNIPSCWDNCMFTASMHTVISIRGGSTWRSRGHVLYSSYCLYGSHTMHNVRTPRTINPPECYLANTKLAITKLVHDIVVVMLGITSGNDCWNRNVFNRCRNVEIDGDDWLWTL